MAIKIKCIFQGGGAKLATLLAASEVLEEYEALDMVKVTEVAGTSAGAIAAFTFANKKETKFLRAKMKSAGHGVVEHFSSAPSLFGLFVKFVRGRSIFDEGKLHAFLRDTFVEDEATRPSLKDAKIPIYVRVSDIKSGKARTYNRDTDISMEQALIDSCAIPFAFRTYKSGSAIADGGIASNLADNAIFNEKDGNVVAFSFPQSAPYEFDNAVSYLASLASTALDASVASARSKIKAQGGFVCELPNDFRTFDFREAFDKGLSDDYFASTKSIIRNQLDSAIRFFESAERRLNVESDLVRVQRFAADLIEVGFQRFPYSVTLNSILCIAGGLGAKSGASDVDFDRVIKKILIVPKRDFLHTFRVGVGKNEAYELGKKIGLDIRDVNGVELKPVCEVIESTQEGKKVWHVCFVFKEPLPAERTPLSVRVATSHIGLMKHLSDGGAEWMRTVCSEYDNVKIQDFVLAYPESSGPFVMTDLLENYHRATVPPDDFESMSDSWHVGRRMDETELKEYVNDHLSLSDFKFVGWRCCDMKPKSYAGALIENASKLM